MSSFSGVVALENDPGSAVAATMEVDAGMLVLKAGGSEIGAWNLDEIKVEQAASGFNLRADGESLILTTPDVAGFATAVGLNPPKKRKRFGFRQKSERGSTVEPDPTPVAAPPPPAYPDQDQDPAPMAFADEVPADIKPPPDLPAFLREDVADLPDTASADEIPAHLPDPDPIIDSLVEPTPAWEPAPAPIADASAPLDQTPSLPSVEDLKAAAHLDAPVFSPPEEPAPAPSISFGTSSEPLVEPEPAFGLDAPEAPSDLWGEAAPEATDLSPDPISAPSHDTAPGTTTPTSPQIPTEVTPEPAFGLDTPEEPSDLWGEAGSEEPLPEANSPWLAESAVDVASPASDPSSEFSSDLASGEDQPDSGSDSPDAALERDVTAHVPVDPWGTTEPGPSPSVDGDPSGTQLIESGDDAAVAAVVEDRGAAIEPLDPLSDFQPSQNGWVSDTAAPPEVIPNAELPALDEFDPSDVAGRDVPDIAGVGVAAATERFVTVEPDESPAAESAAPDHGADMASPQELTDWAEDADGTLESDDAESGGVVPSRFATLRSRSAENYSDENVLRLPLATAMFAAAFGLALGALLTWGIYELSDSFPVERLISAVAAFSVAGGAYLGWRRERRIAGALMVTGGGILAIAAVYLYASEAGIAVGYLLATAGAVSALILGIIGVTRFGHGPDPRIHD